LAIIKSFVSAISLYSKIPMPSLDYKEGEDRFSLCFFPVAGVILFGLCELLLYIGETLSINAYSVAIAFALLPILITGGIHVDGFVDVMDAVHCYGGIEKRHEILKDPHIGAFGVIKLLEVAGIWTVCLFSTDQKLYLLIALGFIVSRAMSGISLLTFPVAKETGMLAFTKSHASKKACIVTLVLWVVASWALGFWLFGIIAVFPTFAEIICMLVYYFKSLKDFGGISGDTAGCFVVMSETAIVFCVFISGCFL